VIFSSVDFPNLNSGNHHDTSDADEFYNCIAWGAGRNDAWWDPQEGSPKKKYYWPAKVPRDDKVTSLIATYESMGFKSCGADGSPEIGMEKIAIYAHGEIYEHAARQLKNGKWTSKIGELEDIEHDAPENLIGPAYGEISTFMKRRMPLRLYYLFPLGRRAYIR
jgi:hypothetical protein